MMVENPVPSLQAALDAKRGDWQQIAKSAGVSYSWLSKFARNTIPNPGIETLRRLSDALDSGTTNLVA